MVHLWEGKHSYYCHNNNYYNNECLFEFDSWDDFMDEMGGSDLDYNLLFRWDWVVPSSDDLTDDADTGEALDVESGTGKLYCYWMQQRKGRFTVTCTDVTAKDELAVIEFLKPRLTHLKELWLPLE